jgi:hypothetical protein
MAKRKQSGAGTAEPEAVSIYPTVRAVVDTLIRNWRFPDGPPKEEDALIVELGRFDAALTEIFSDSVPFVTRFFRHSQEPEGPAPMGATIGEVLHMAHTSLLMHYPNSVLSKAFRTSMMRHYASGKCWLLIARDRIDPIVELAAFVAHGAHKAGASTETGGTNNVSEQE